MSTVTNEAQTDVSAAAPERSRRTGHAVGVGVLGVLAVLAVLASTLAVWSRVTLFSSERVADIVVDTLDDTAVNAALSKRVTESVFDAVDVEARLQEVLPPALSRVAPAIAGGLESRTEAAVSRLLARDDVQQVVRQLVERAHQSAMKLLEGDGLVSGVSVQNGEVSLNLVPLVVRGITIVQGFGLLSDVTIPELPAGDPAGQVAALSKALGRDLPPSFGQLVVYRSEDLAKAEAALENAQRAVVLFKRAVVVIVVAALVLLAATILLAANRRKVILRLGLGVAAALVVAWVIINRVLDSLAKLAIEPDARQATRDVLSRATDGLYRLSLALVVVGIVAALIAYLTGPGGDRFTGGRRSVAGLVQHHRQATGVVAFALAVGALVLFGFSWLGVIVAVLLVGLGIWALAAPTPTPATTSAGGDPGAG